MHRGIPKASSISQNWALDERFKKQWMRQSLAVMRFSGSRSNILFSKSKPFSKILKRVSKFNISGLQSYRKDLYSGLSKFIRQFLFWVRMSLYPLPENGDFPNKLKFFKNNKFMNKNENFVKCKNIKILKDLDQKNQKYSFITNIFKKKITIDGK